MKKLIYLEDAIDALMAEPLKWDDSSVWESARCHQWMMDMDVIKALSPAQPELCEDADKLKRCRFEYVNACKIVACPTPDTSKNDIYDAYAVMKALYPIFSDEE